MCAPSAKASTKATEHAGRPGRRQTPRLPTVTDVVSGKTRPRSCKLRSSMPNLGGAEGLGELCQPRTPGLLLRFASTHQRHRERVFLRTTRRA